MHAFLGDTGGLSNYKPSTLLVEIPDNNIDTKLGQKNLVVPSTRSIQPVPRSRTAIDQWSANNGSVIYAQSNTIKNNFMTTATNGNEQPLAGGRPKESQVNFKISSMSSVYLNNRTVIAGHEPNVSSTNLGGQKQLENGASNTFHNSNSEIVPTNHHQSSQINGKSINGTIPAIQNQEKDLSHVSSNKWSNGTCATSDLLF